MQDRTAELKTLMEQHELSAADVGALLDRSAQTVRCWRCQWDARVIPEHTLIALRAKIAEQAAA